MLPFARVREIKHLKHVYLGTMILCLPTYLKCGRSLKWFHALEYEEELLSSASFSFTFWLKDCRISKLNLLSQVRIKMINFVNILYSSTKINCCQFWAPKSTTRQSTIWVCNNSTFHGFEFANNFITVISIPKETQKI